MPRTGEELADQFAVAAIARPHLFAQLSHQDIERIVDCYSDHLGIDLPSAGQGRCCSGALLLGPQACTCWTAVYDLEQQPIQPGTPTVPTPARMCGDCAYRPGSPEKQGDDSHRGDQELLDRLVATGEPFYCHTGIRRKASHRHPSGTILDGHPGDYDPPIVDGVPYKASGEPGDLCAGWLLRRVKEAGK